MCVCVCVCVCVRAGKCSQLQSADGLLNGKRKQRHVSLEDSAHCVTSPLSACLLVNTGLLTSCLHFSLNMETPNTVYFVTQSVNVVWWEICLNRFAVVYHYKIRKKFDMLFQYL